SRRGDAGWPAAREGPRSPSRGRHRRARGRRRTGHRDAPRDDRHGRARDRRSRGTDRPHAAGGPRMSLALDVLTLFPKMFESPFAESIISRARQAGLVSLAVHDIRTWTSDRHHVVDDAPYGGGAGMVMKAEPLARAIRAVRGS